MARRNKIRRIEALIWGISFIALLIAGPFYGSTALATEEVSNTTTTTTEPSNESTTTSTVDSSTSTSTSTTTTTIPPGPTPISNAGFEDNAFTGWDKGSQTGTLGASIAGNGTGVTIFTGSRTFTHGSNGAMGSPNLSNGSPNPYYAPAVAAGSWTFSPNNATYAVLLQPKGEQNFAQAMTALGLSGSPETALRGTLTTQAQASGFGGGNPTDAAWITREVQLTAGVTYTMNWNYLGTDYVPFNDGSITSLVAVSTPSSPTITVNNSVGVYALLGFTNPGTGDYSTNSYGASGWQMSTYKVSVTGTYKLGFAVFNLDDQALSPVLMVDNASGGTQRCAPAGSNCTSFGGVVSNNPTAPTVVPATTTTTIPPTTTTTIPAPTSLQVTSLLDDGSSGTLRWAITQANSQNGGIYDSISFASGLSGTITLTSSLPAIVGSLTVTGNGQTNTIIDGNNLYRPFWVGQGNSLTVSNLTLKQGQSADGGLIFNTKGTVSATNVRFTGMTGGSAVFNKEAGSVATYTNCTFDYLNTGIAADHGSTPSLPAGITTWANQADSVFQNRTYVVNSTFSNNGSGINSQRFTKIQNSTFTNNSYGAALSGWNRAQVLNSTFTGNGIAIYHSSWISTTANMGTDNRLIDGNTFTNNGTSIYLDDGYNNGQKHQGWATVTNNNWDANGTWVVYYLWNGTNNAYGSVTPTVQTTVFSQSNNTVVLPPYYNVVQNLAATVNSDGSVSLDWDAPLAGNLQPHMYDVSWADLVDGAESGGWGVWTHATNTAYEIGSFQFPNTSGYGPVRIKVRAGNAACVGEGTGSCVYGPYSTVDVVIPDPSTVSTPVVPLQPLLPEPESEPEPELPQDEPETPLPVEQEPEEEDAPNTTAPEVVDETVDEDVAEEEPSVPAEPEEQQDAILEAIEEASPAAIVQLVNELDSLFDSDNLTDEDVAVIAEAVDSILEQGIDEEVAAELASSEVVLESISQEQAAEIFNEIDESGLTTEQAAAIVEAVQDAPSEVRQAFEAVIAIFSGAFDSYTMLNQNITVGQRRTVIAANLLVSAAAASAMLASSRPAPTPAPTTHRQEMAARREDEEEASGEISGDGVEWIRQIRIFKYVDGVRVMDWKAFIKKFAYGIMNMGFTLAGSLVVYLTLSGPIQKIAGISTVLAIAAAMWLHMKEPDES